MFEDEKNESTQGTQETKVDNTPTDLEEVTLPNGEIVNLNKAERHRLMWEGAQKLIDDRKKKVEEPREDETKEEESTDKVVILEKKLDKALNEVAQLREEQNKDRTNRSAAERRARIESEINVVLKEHDLTKDDEDVANTARKLIINNLLTNPSMTIKDAFKEEIKTLEKLAKKNEAYLKEKKEDAEQTRGAGKGKPASPNPDKVSADEFMRGGVRKRVMKKLAAERKAGTSRFGR